MSRFTKDYFLLVFFIIHIIILLVSGILIFNAIIETENYKELFEYSNDLYLALILLMPICSIISLFTWGVINERKRVKCAGTIIGGIMSVVFCILFIVSITLAFHFDIQWNSQEINEKRVDIETEVCFLFHF